MISRDLTITVNNNTATLSEPLTIYRYDRGIKLNLKIVEYKFKFNRLSEENILIKNTSLIYARVLVHKPNGEGCFEIPIASVGNETVEVVIEQTWTDELEELGMYQLQIQLYGENPVEQRVTIPPVSFQVEPTICDIEEDFSDEVGVARADAAQISENGEDYNSNYANGEYHSIEWNTGDIITSNSLNKMEHAINYSIEELSNIYRKEEVNALVNEINQDTEDLANEAQTLKTQVNQNTTDIKNHTHEGMITSMSASRVEFVEEYPSEAEMEENVLYILVEKVEE